MEVEHARSMEAQHALPFRGGWGCAFLPFPSPPPLSTSRHVVEVEQAIDFTPPSRLPRWLLFLPFTAQFTVNDEATIASQPPRSEELFTLLSSTGVQKPILDELCGVGDHQLRSVRCLATSDDDSKEAMADTFNVDKKTNTVHRLEAGKFVQVWQQAKTRNENQQKKS